MPIPIAHGPATGSKVQQAAQRAERRAEEDEHATQTLQLEVERLFMITEAFWTLMKDRQGYADKDLEALVTEIDLRDGKLGGKSASVTPRSCPSCKRPVSTEGLFCVYCGTRIMPELFQR